MEGQKQGKPSPEQPKPTPDSPSSPPPGPDVMIKKGR